MAILNFQKNTMIAMKKCHGKYLVFYNTFTIEAKETLIVVSGTIKGSGKVDECLSTRPFVIDVCTSMIIKIIDTSKESVSIR